MQNQKEKDQQMRYLQQKEKYEASLRELANYKQVILKQPQRAPGS